MNLPYEILLRSNGGIYSGAHVIDAPGGTARGVKPEDWPELANSINSASLARVAELEEEATTKDKAHTEAMATKDAVTAATTAAKDEEIAALKAAHVAEIDSLVAERTAELQARAEAAEQLCNSANENASKVAADFKAHQDLVDDAVAKAAKALQEQDVEALQEILGEVSVYPEQRRKAALQAEIEATEARLAELQAEV